MWKCRHSFNVLLLLLLLLFEICLVSVSNCSVCEVAAFCVVEKTLSKHVHSAAAGTDANWLNLTTVSAAA